MTYKDDLPKSEKQHFMKCDCGEYFDMRDLEDVFKHFHKSQLAKEVEYSHSVKVGEPVIYTKTQGRIDIN